MPKVKIGELQLISLMANLVFGKAIGYTSEVLARSVGHDAWLAMLIAFLIGFPVMGATVWLARRVGPVQPAVYLPRLLGRPLGKLALALLAIFFFISFVTSAITIEQHISDYLMNETPMLVFVVGYTLLSLYGAYLGLEVIARLSVLGLLLTILLNISMTAGSVNHFDPVRLLPPFYHGLLPTAAASVSALPDVAFATAGALVLLPATKSPERWLRLSWWGLGLGAILVTTWTVFEIGVLGPEVTAQYLIACMQLARSAEFSIYLHRYELIMVVLFVYGVMTQSILCLYAGCELTAAVLPRKIRRGWLYAICAGLTIPLNWWLARDRDSYGLFLAREWPAIAVPLGMGLPLLFCLAALLRPSVRPGATAR